jgi:replication initiation protein RepC
MSLAMLATQMTSGKIDPKKSVDKWKLYRALCEAKPRLGITDRALAVLNALLSFYPKNELAEEHGLIVFPSNTQLSLRAHGMAEQTIRRHLAALIDAGLLIRKDSPNGKRYAHRDRSGGIHEAFGFSLAPLLTRSEEIERLAADVIADRLHLQRLKERLTLCRRDITKLVETAFTEDVAGDWPGIMAHMRGLLTRLPRVSAASDLESSLDEMELLREEVINQLEIQLKTQIESANPHQNERHIQSSDSESFPESEPGAVIECRINFRGGIDPQSKVRIVGKQQAFQPETRVGKDNTNSLKAFPLGLVLQACPQISDYAAAGGPIRSWRDLMSAAIVVRSMLGVSPSAYQHACSIMGPENAAAVMACILERGGHINSAGGYLRDLTRRTERNEFALGPMLMALLRGNGTAAGRVSRPGAERADCDPAERREFALLSSAPVPSPSVRERAVRLEPCRVSG